MKTAKKSSLGVLMGVVALLWLIPLYYLVINSFKPIRDVIMHTGEFPKSLYLDNFAEVWKMTNYPVLLRNSFVVTAGAVALIVLLSSMAGYKLARSRSKGANWIILYFLVAMVVPFQAIMIPLVRLMSNLHLVDNLFGIVLLYGALQAPMAIYLYYGAAKGISPALEESAKIDGAGPFRTFFSVVFPLLAPMTVTVIILNSLWIWNDFLLPLVMLSSPLKKTIPLGTTALFFGQFMNKWNLGITAIFIASLPMLILYLALQKFVVRGITEGSVKG